MKKYSNTLLSHLSLAEILILTTAVEETLVKGVTSPCKKTFTEAELWNIQRRRKRIAQRRFL